MQPSASKRAVVLVVEDEPLVRMDAIDAIEAAGLDVVGASDADEAIAILERRSDHFVKNRWPPIKIIATSGHAKITEKDLPEGTRFLPKPYAVVEVARAIDQLIRQ
jgi:DNA-binding NtrC family response regulator